MPWPGHFNDVIARWFSYLLFDFITVAFWWTWYLLEFCTCVWGLFGSSGRTFNLLYVSWLVIGVYTRYCVFAIGFNQWSLIFMRSYRAYYLSKSRRTNRRIHCLKALLVHWSSKVTYTWCMELLIQEALDWSSRRYWRGSGYQIKEHKF